MVPAPALHLKIGPPRSLLSVSRCLHPSLHGQPARLAHRPGRRLTTRLLPTRMAAFSRPFMSSPPRPGSQGQSDPTGMEWYELSPERKIKWMLSSAGDAKWGWVIYRCTYKPELDGPWEDFKRVIDEGTRKSIAGSDAPEIAEKLDWAFVEDPALERASLDELKRRFRAWARAECPNYDIDNTPYCRGSRYTYFIQVDEGALLSLLDDPETLENPVARADCYSGFVNIVRAWQDGEAVDSEDWMKIQASMIAPELYVDLDNDESWYTYYSPPSEGICRW